MVPSAEFSVNIPAAGAAGVMPWVRPTQVHIFHYLPQAGAQAGLAPGNPIEFKDTYPLGVVVFDRDLSVQTVGLGHVDHPAFHAELGKDGDWLRALRAVNPTVPMRATREDVQAWVDAPTQTELGLPERADHFVGRVHEGSIFCRFLGLD